MWYIGLDMAMTAAHKVLGDRQTGSCRLSSRSHFYGIVLIS